MKRLIAAMIVVVAAGCAGSGNHVSAPPPRPGDPPRWLYWPTTMRIHPLTRLADDLPTGTRVIEARVELRDRDGITARAMGTMYLGYFASRADLPTEPIEKWQIDLSDPAVNAERFDVVTRTYLFKLEITVPPAGDGGVLRAWFVTADGLELEDILVLE